MIIFLLPIVLFCIFMSIRTLFIPNTIKGKLVSVENFFYLCTVYLTVIIGFGLIFLILELMGMTVLAEANKEHQYNIFETSFYFSAMMLFSVGNGDVIPQGIGRIIAAMEALIGYTLPAAFVAKVMVERKK
ncbi:ion channel [Neobacillus mesonae]|uniref:ion channel n=1 Tax=Neobacillus mesonae TaxID=1193713 RepID=UPI00203D7635|nr:ion channel [Neobacillus mesonae]MCM3569421.1 ion channel [Neobacillus mesonae]